MSFVLVLILVVKSIGRLTLNSSECLIYLSKLEKLQFEKSLKIAPIDEKINITFGYQDPLFNNDTFWGLTADDGKLIEQTCLDLKIWIFKSRTYQDLLYNKNPELQFSNNSISKLRYISFGIDVAAYQKNFFLEFDYLDVYFGIIYYAAGTNQILKSQKFQFSFKFNAWSRSRLPTTFKSLNQYETESCWVGIECVQKKNIWCTDLTCRYYEFPEFFILYEIYVVKQNLTFADQIFETNLIFIGNGTKEIIQPLQQIYSSSYVIFQFSFNSVLNNGTLQINIQFSSSNINYSVNGYENIPCIKKDGNSETECSTCKDQCEINQISIETQCDCELYNLNHSKALIFIVLFQMIL